MISRLKDKNKNNTEPLVSILVLNYNGKRFLKDCFDSLQKSAYPNYEIIMIDNKSTDDSVDFTKKNYPEIKIIQTHSNGGYSRAYNHAFESADGKYFVLLNNDVIVEKNWLEPLVESAEEDHTIAALQPKIRSLIEKDYFDYAGASGGYMDKYGYPFLRGRIFYTIEKDETQYNTEAEVFWTSGAAMFLRAEALTKSGPLDEDFFLHMEEIDLCWRLNLLGYKLKVIPKSVIYHYAGGTLKAESYGKLYWNHRNGWITLIKNLEKGNLLKVSVVRYLLDVLNLLYAGFIQFNPAHAYAILKSHVWILFHLKFLLKKRKLVQDIRVKSDSDISHLVYQKALVFAYFFRKKKTFQSLGFRADKIG